MQHFHNTARNYLWIKAVDICTATYKFLPNPFITSWLCHKVNFTHNHAQPAGAVKYTDCFSAEG